MTDNYYNRLTSESEKQKVFFKLFSDNQSHIYSYILKLVNQISIADDIFQEVALAMWEHFDKYEIGSDFCSWGIRISRNKVIDYVRKNKAKPLCYSEKVIELISDQHSRKYDDKDNRIKALASCVSKLPANDKHLIQLKYSQKITTKALSERTGRSVNGLYKSLARVHSVLYQCIRKTLESDN